ncbi:MAG: hypothetical protein A3J06_02825 [Candidatus Moranbacteria bacterium RIFCSPLOWO2_02_FULL_48_19]|nr:MAG: hypothetical protein A3J06_02825 [Candidatus Moranbacteria bacterium RIFCSPLOWO2_02_FULL_48_19]OGI31416.1 MAG: hypothetical protein A3G09_03070 [Candidatus Moranbacteria bacterium RIFCSPLOWO2_12_FULL_48_12]
MATKLYVGGVSYGTTEDSLREAFAQAGNVVSAKIIIDKMTGRSRGFAFVEMGSEDDAQKAIALWNGKELDGRTLTVNEARPLEERAPRTSGSGGFRGGNSGNRDYGSGNQGGSRW